MKHTFLNIENFCTWSFLSFPFHLPFSPPLLPHIGLDFWIPSTSILNPDQLLVSAAREIPAMPASCYPLGESLKAHDLSCSSWNGFPGNSRPPPRTNRGVGAAPWSAVGTQDLESFRTREGVQSARSGSIYVLPRNCRIRNFASIPQTFPGCCGLQIPAHPHLHSSSGPGGVGAGPALLMLQKLPAYTARVN